MAIDSPYSPIREFGLAGTLTGVPGTGNLYALGSAFFDTVQPNIKQAGILTINPGSTAKLSESARTVLTTSPGIDRAGRSQQRDRGQPLDGPRQPRLVPRARHPAWSTART